MPDLQEFARGRQEKTETSVAKPPLTATAEPTSQEVQQLKAEVGELKANLYELIYVKHIYAPHDEDEHDSEEAYHAWVNRAHGAAAAACQVVPTTATTTDTSEPTSQEVQQLKAWVVELNAEIEKVKAEIHTRRYDDDNDYSEEAWGPITCLIQAGDELAQTTATTTDTSESASQEVQQLKAEVVRLKTMNGILEEEIAELKFALKAVTDTWLASNAAHDQVTQKLKQEIAQLRAEVTAVPDDIP